MDTIPEVIKVGTQVKVKGDDWWRDWKTVDVLVITEIFVRYDRPTASPVLVITDTKGRSVNVYQGMWTDFEFLA